jgi:hypothetical protein
VFGKVIMAAIAPEKEPEGVAPGAAPAAPGASVRRLLVASAGVASLGAGAIHAAAIGVHPDPRATAVAFALVAAAQLCWGAVALVRSRTPVVVAGVLLGVVAVAGWAMAKTAGIPFVDGLDTAEPIQVVDALAAVLALASVVMLALSLTASEGGASPDRPTLLVPIAAVVTAIALYGMLTVSDHHAEAETGAPSEGHHGATPGKAGGEHDMSAMPGPDGAGGHGEGHSPSVAVPYDPTKPIDLGGVEGVTLEEQAAAENLVAVTLLRLPRWKDPAVAEAAGFYSIGDGMTGTEHFVNQAFIDDEVFLDPDKPESLVYDTTKGGRELVAAMYMVKPGTPLSEVPRLGGKLTQWHTHENLCYRPDGRLGGLTDAEGKCRAGLTKPPPTPMIHTWITPHKCGPFASLEGIGGGTIAAGEERLCDTAHGS